MKDNVAQIGIVGCGNISGHYMENMPGFPNLKVVACADIDAVKAAELGDKFDLRVLPVDELVAHDDIDAVLNLTIPSAHAEIAIQALQNGKHVYNEKPLGTTREQGRAILQCAAENGVRVGCAPDTFLGAGQQTCRMLVDDGTVGKPFTATASMMSPGPVWHQNPDFFFRPGGGPLFDMGPYYLTTLVNMLGPAQRVVGFTTRGFDERVRSTGPNAGAKIPVELDTTIMGVIEFVSGPIVTFQGSFDLVGAHNLPRIELHGTEGSLSIPDPNNFDGSVRFHAAGGDGWKDMDLVNGQTTAGRGLGLSDMIRAIGEDRPHRASGELAFHVLDIMEAFYDASEEGRAIELESTCVRPTVMG